MESDGKVKAAVVAAIGGVLVALISGVFQFLQGQEIKANSIGSLEAGQKVCSVRFTESSGPVNYSWRDSIVVPKSWDAGDCSNFQNIVSPSGKYQLACAFEDSFELGSINGTPPAKNCGW